MSKNLNHDYDAAQEMTDEAEAQVRARYHDRFDDEYDHWKARSIDTDVHQLFLNLELDDK
jgi:hypothetical protein